MRLRYFLALSGAMLVVAPTLLAGSPTWCRAQAETWPPPFPMYSTPVDVAGDVGRSCSIALRPNGDVLIAYYDATLGALKLAERIQNVWHVPQFVAPVEPSSFSWCSLALDPTDTPHIVYGGTGLRHLARIDGFWVQDTVTALGNTDGNLVADSNGGLHVSFFSWPTGTFYAHKDSGPWTVEPVCTIGGGNGQFSSVAVRSEGTPAVCLRAAGLWIYTRTDGAWVRDMSVPSTPDLRATSMTFGSDNMLRVAFQHLDGTGGIDYLAQTPSGWILDEVKHGGGAYCVSMRLNSHNDPLIAFINGSHSSVLLAFGEPGNWQVQPVDSAGAAPSLSPSCSMGLDAQGFPRLAYYTGDAGGDLRFVEGPAGLSVPSGRGLTEVYLGAPRPNPARSLGRVSIECGSPAAVEARLVLYDLMGREIACGDLERVEHASTLSLQLPSVPAGLVVAALQDGTGRILASRRLALLR